MMPGIEREAAKTLNQYSLAALLYHVIVTYPATREVQGHPAIVTEYTEDGLEQVREIIDYARKIFNATHEEQLTLEEAYELVRDLATKYHVAASRDSLQEK